ncbi:MAG: nitroreductase family deazaflavin-dependent oxidoreductase [Nitriliruptoraceae bacterium]
MAANDHNARVIEEFRANGGAVGGPFAGVPIVLLHHRGRRTGTERVTPVVAQIDGERLFIFASKAGADEHPQWYHNLKAHPEIDVEYGTETFPVRVVELDGAERDRVWERQKQKRPQFADYEAKTDRVIPVLELIRQA